VIEHSKLSREEKNDVRHNLGAFNYVLKDVGERQTEWRESDRNGQAEQKPKPQSGPKKKRQPGAPGPEPAGA
jgi:hypothetical protein